MLSSPLASHNIPPECRVRERIKSLNLRLSISAVIFFPPPYSIILQPPEAPLSPPQGNLLPEGKTYFSPLSFPFRVPSVENEEHPESGSGKRREAGKMKKRQIEGWPFSAGRGTFFPPFPALCTALSQKSNFSSARPPLPLSEAFRMRISQMPGFSTAFRYGCCGVTASWVSRLFGRSRFR